MFLSFLQYEHTSMNLHIYTFCSQKIKSNIKDCNVQVKRISNNEDRQFALKLINYCEKRNTEARIFSDNLGTMMNRTNYVLNIIEAFVKDENGIIQNMLTEKTFCLSKDFSLRCFMTY
jgi:hypothetical protein